MAGNEDKVIVAHSHLTVKAPVHTRAESSSIYRETGARNSINEDTINGEVRQCYACGSSEHQIKDCTSGQNVFVTYLEQKHSLRTVGIRREMERYGQVKSGRVRMNRWGEDTL